MKKLSILTLAATRWTLDVVRGYQRVADGREGVTVLLSHPPRIASLDAERDWLGAVTDLRALPGGIGLGARLALSAEELRAIALQVEDRRAELLAHPGPSGEA